MRKLLKTPGRFCDMLVLLRSLKIHLDQLYRDTENGATETGTVFQSSVDSPTQLEEMLVEAVNSVNDCEGRSQDERRDWKRTVTLVTALAVDEGSTKHDRACDEDVDFLRGSKCLEEPVKTKMKIRVCDMW
jgi:hypothetical protein